MCKKMPKNTFTNCLKVWDKKIATSRFKKSPKNQGLNCLIWSHWSTIERMKSAQAPAAHPVSYPRLKISVFFAFLIISFIFYLSFPCLFLSLLPLKCDLQNILISKKRGYFTTFTPAVSFVSYQESQIKWSLGVRHLDFNGLRRE